MNNTFLKFAKRYMEGLQNVCLPQNLKNRQRVRNPTFRPKVLFLANPACLMANTRLKPFDDTTYSYICEQLYLSR